MDRGSLIDLTQALDEHTQIYPGDPPFSCCSFLTAEKDGFNVATLAMGTHTGTHIDAPYHIHADGARLDEIPLELLVGPALVVDLTQKSPRSEINWKLDLEPYASHMRPGVILVLHTGWSRHWGTPQYLNHPHLSRDAAEQIVSTGVRVVGIDALSPDPVSVEEDKSGLDDDAQPGAGPPSDNYPAHSVILGIGGVIAENLTNLSALQSLGDSAMISLLPLKITGADGAPVRAVGWCSST